MIIVVNKRYHRGGGVYIGRLSLLGNPFGIGEHGDRKKPGEIGIRTACLVIGYGEIAEVSPMPQVADGERHGTEIFVSY